MRCDEMEGYDQDKRSKTGMMKIDINKERNEISKRENETWKKGVNKNHNRMRALNAKTQPKMIM